MCKCGVDYFVHAGENVKCSGFELGSVLIDGCCRYAADPLSDLEMKEVSLISERKWSKIP